MEVGAKVIYLMVESYAINAPAGDMVTDDIDKLCPLSESARLGNV